jgi:hypothetical protein
MFLAARPEMLGAIHETMKPGIGGRLVTSTRTADVNCTPPKNPAARATPRPKAEGRVVLES